MFQLFRRSGLRVAGTILFLGTLTNPAPTVAETAYVIDELMAGIRASTSITDKVLRVVPTGTQLFVLERNGEFAKVRTEDGLEGWIDDSYLMTQPPAAIRLAAAEQALHLAQAQLADRIGVTASVNPAAPGEPTAAPRYLSIGAGAIIIGLLIGFVAGSVWHTQKERRKLAGYKI